MELKLYDAEVKLRVKVPTDEAPPALAAPRVVVVLPASGDGPEKNKERPLPCKLHVAIPNGGEESSEALEQPIVLKVFDGRQVLVSRGLTLKECIPVLSDGAITWSQEISRKGTDAVLDVSIQVKTDRRPRLLINQAILMKRRALEVAHQLSLHKNKVVVGLVPPVLGCLVGIVATSPVWLPLTLLVGIMGAPVWFVVAVAGSLVLVFAVLSTVVTVKAVRSARLKAAVTQFLRSPQGQLLLFEGAATEQGMSPSQLAARIQQHVMENPSSKLMASLAIDFLGNATFVVPGLGELADVLWAPVSAKLVSGMYSESSPHAKYVAFFEELLPFTDFIPTATLAWMKENLSSPELEKLMRLVRPSAATA